MKVLFLDFDGVLNSEQFVRAVARGSTKWKNTDLDHRACSNLQYILDQVPDCKIVISSTWRKLYELEELKKFLSHMGVDAERVIDVTPYRLSDRIRGGEIAEWLEDAKDVTSFAIVDDDSDMGELMHRLVRTDSTDGLTLSKAKAIVDMLNSPTAAK